MRIVIRDIPCMTAIRLRSASVLLLPFLLAGSALGQNRPQSLSKTEQRIVSGVDPDVSEGLALLERLVHETSSNR